MDEARRVSVTEQHGVPGETLEERLRFENLLANLSARFVNLSAERIDDDIKDAQRRICELLDVDRSSLWQFSEQESGALLLTHLHQPPQATVPPERMDAAEFFPWTVQRIRSREALVINRLSDVPPEASRDRKSFLHYGTKSTVLLPLAVGGKPVLGLLGFAVLREERIWSKTVVRGFELIAQVLANAISRLQDEKALREGEARLNLALNAAGVGLWTMDLDTLHVWGSSILRKMFHFAPEADLTFQSFLRVAHPDDREGLKEAVQRTVQSGESLSVDYRILLPDGSVRWIGAQGHRYPRTEPVRLMGVSLDITSQKNQEVEASAVREQLQSSERLLRMGQLTASLAHELNQPLTSILFNAEAALRLQETKRLDDETLKEILHDIASDDKRAGEIIRGLRAMFERREGERKPVDIDRMILDVLGLFKREVVFRSLKVQTEFASFLPPVSANRTQLQQVMINLIMNAAESIPDASPERRVTIRTHRSNNNFVQVAVCDTGTGIAEKDLDSIFEPTFTTKRSGFGLGLSLSRSIIETHGGKIHAQNNPDGGATFFFELPAMGRDDR